MPALLFVLLSTLSASPPAPVTTPPPPGSVPANHLAGASSPYLLLHQHNPVDWYPWGEEALERARREDKPIFLSVGYSTCYWCHVMERESFSDPAVAALMNEHFVSIKVDREERPDLDEIYMTATQIFAGQGGWPNSVFLTPDLRPFYAGTYFPPDDRYGRPSFPRVLRSLAEAWTERRADVEEQAGGMAAAMRQYFEARGGPAVAPPGPHLAQLSFTALAERFDAEWGGFGGAPKFPTPSNLLLLLELAEEEPRAAEMLAVTLDRMARGGFWDQVGGGFHRYSTDREWRVPHFEKMLYDNALLLEVYARAWQLGRESEHARIAREIAAFLAAELSDPDGGFHSAIDAETDGFEGGFYVWTRDQLAEVLGEEDFGFAAPILGFDGPPFFPEAHGSPTATPSATHYVLHLTEPLALQAQRRRVSQEELLAQLASIRARLAAARARRERPLTDDKVLADWNGMAIGALAVAGAILEEPEMVARATLAANFALTTMRRDGGPLLHAWRRGGSAAEGGIPAFLADYAWLVRGLLALHRATGEERWLAAACEVAAEQEARLADPAGGWFNAAAAADLLFRSKELFDGATPAANPIAVLNAIELAGRTGEERWSAAARRAFQSLGPLAERQPDAARTMALAARRFHAAGLAGSAVAPAGPKAADPLQAEAVAAVQAIAYLGEPGGEGWRSLRVELDIAPGWHLYAPAAAEAGVKPIVLRAAAAELSTLDYPAGREERVPGPAERMETVRVYLDRTVVRGAIRWPQAGGRLLLDYQACDDRRCLPPVTVEVPVRPD